MALTLSGATNSIAGLAVGGLPDGTVDADSLAANAVTAAKMATGVGGKMLSTPVVGTSSTEYSWTSTTYSDTDLTASITPSATSSKILVLCNLNVETYANQTVVALGIRLMRDSTIAHTIPTFARMNNNAAVDYYRHGCFFWLDSPSTTSAITYKIQGARTYTWGSGTLMAVMNQIGGEDTSYMMLTEIAG